MKRTCWLLRPLAFGAEDDLAGFATAMQFPIIHCDLCGSQDGLQRNVMKQMIADIEQRIPSRKDIMIRTLGNANPSHLLDQGNCLNKLLTYVHFSGSKEWNAQFFVDFACHSPHKTTTLSPFRGISMVSKVRAGKRRSPGL